MLSLAAVTALPDEEQREDRGGGQPRRTARGSADRTVLRTTVVILETMDSNMWRLLSIYLRREGTSDVWT